jgi:methyl-accepting chemotaxis protein
MPDYADTLTQLAQARDDAKVMLTELRGTIKDSRQAKNEAMEFIRQTAAFLVVSAVNHTLQKEQETVRQGLQESLETMTRKVASKANEVTTHMDEQLKEMTEVVENVTVAVEGTNKVHELVHWMHDVVHKHNDALAEMKSQIEALAVLQLDDRNRLQRLEEINDRRASEC